MSEKETQLSTIPKDQKLVSVDDSPFSTLMDTAKFEHLFRVANAFARSDMVPSHFRGKPENCMLAVQMAIRMDLDPLMVLQNTYIVRGRPGMEGKLIIGLVNSHGPFTGPIQYELDDEEQPTKCTAFATHKITGEVCKATITWEMIEKEGWNKDKPTRDGSGVQKSKWNTMPAQMFRYRSAVFLARAYCPEVLMGFYTTDELRDIEGEAAPKRPISTLEEKLSKSITATVVSEKPGKPPASKPKKEKPTTTADPKTKAEVDRQKDKLAEAESQEQGESEPHKEPKEFQEFRFYCRSCDNEFATVKEKQGKFQCPKCLGFDVIDRRA